MAQKFLLALDGSENSTRAVVYLADMIRGRAGVHLTLFHVIPIPPDLLEHGGAENPDRERLLAGELRTTQREWREETEASVEKEIFAPARQILEARGVQADRSTVETKIAIESHPDVAMAIVDEIKNNGCGTIVLGKRGRSKVEDFLFGGVTCKLIHHLRECTIWVVE
jgi:nucleotide-binding universal stress UspA family protein